MSISSLATLLPETPNGAFTPTEAPINDWIAEERAQSLPDAKDVQLYRRYAKGKHPIELSDEEKAALRGLLGNWFCDNLTHQVLSINAARIQFSRFDISPPAKMQEKAGQNDADEVRDFLSDTGRKCHAQSFFSESAYAMVRDGNDYAGIGWEPFSQRPLWFHEPAWDGFCGMYLAYDSSGQPAYAVKEWVATEPPPQYHGVLGVVQRFLDTLLAREVNKDKEYRYRTLYLPDQIQYFRQESGKTAWEAHERPIQTLNGVEFSSRVLWLRPDGSPLGLPVVHYANGSRTEGLYGESEVSGGFLGVQDSINTHHRGLDAVGLYTSYQRTYTAGIGLARGADGTITVPGFDNAPGANTFIEDPAGRMGVIPAGESAPAIDIIRFKIATACRMTATPLHLITGGDWPSGEAILRAEAPLVNKANKQIAKMAPAVVEMGHRSTEIANARANLGLNEDAPIEVVFEPTEKRDPLALAQTVALIADDVSRKERLRLLGYTSEQIQRIETEQEEESAQALKRQEATLTMQAALNPQKSPQDNLPAKAA